MLIIVRRAWSLLCSLYVQVFLFCAMSFLFKPPFVAAFRNLVFLQWTSSLSPSIATSQPFSSLWWASSSSRVLLQHLGLLILCVLLFVLFPLFFEIEVAFSSWLSISIYNIKSNFMKPLKIVLFAQISQLVIQA